MSTPRNSHPPPVPSTPSDEAAALDARTERVLAVSFSLLLLVLVLSPITENWEGSPDDGFPLSYYPMFTTDRDGDQRVTFLAGTDAAGQRHLLSYTLAGTGGFNQVRRQIRKRAREDADELCAAVAAEIVREDDDVHAGLTEVHVIRGRFLFDDYFAGNKEPVSENVYATCAINWDPS